MPQTQIFFLRIELIKHEKITWLVPKYLLRFLISVVMRSVDMNASVSLTSDRVCLGKWTTPYECLLPLPLPSTQEWWEKHNGWEHYSTLHPWPSRDLQTMQVPGSERLSQSCPPSSFPPPENKQRKSTLLRNALRYRLNVYCCSWDSLNPTILRRTRLRKVWRWRALTLPGDLIHISGRLCSWVSFFQRLPSALLIQSLPGSPAHIVSALAPLHTCSVW